MKAVPRSFRQQFIDDNVKRLPWIGMIGAPGYPEKELWKLDPAYNSISSISVEYESTGALKSVAATSGTNVARIEFAFDSAKEVLTASIYSNSVLHQTLLETYVPKTASSGMKLVLEVANKQVAGANVKVTFEEVLETPPSDDLKYNLDLEFNGKVFSAKNIRSSSETPPKCIGEYFTEIAKSSTVPISLPVPDAMASVLLGDTGGASYYPTTNWKAWLGCAIACGVIGAATGGTGAVVAGVANRLLVVQVQDAY